MPFDNVICAGDPLRNTRAFLEGYFDLLREPIAQGTAFEIGYPLSEDHAESMLPGFSLERFRALSAGPGIDWTLNWPATFFQLPEQALEYFFEHVPRHSLMLCFEMPAWMTQGCIERKIPFIDLRASPLRFGRDLYIGLRTNDPALYARIEQETVSVEELRLEAATLAANVRMHRRRLEEAGQSGFALGRSLVFIGQAPYDASLLTPDGAPLLCEDFIPELLERLDGRTLIHKPHPFSPSFGATQRQTLESACGVPVGTCHMSAYQLLTSDDDVELIGISSGLLQEAGWFNKTAHTLYQPYVPLALPDDNNLQAFQQVRFADWCSPGFWHRLLAPQRPAPKLDRLPALPHHYARETFDQWWDYSKVLTWQRALSNETFQRGGGQLLRNEFEQLRERVERMALSIDVE